MKHSVRAAMVACLIGVSLPASAGTYLKGTINRIAPDVYPEQGVVFQMNVGYASCPAGSWIFFRAYDSEKLDGVHAAVLAAYLAVKPVQVALNGCEAYEVRPWN